MDNGCEKPLSAVIYSNSYIDRYTTRNDRIIKEIRKKNKNMQKKEKKAMLNALLKLHTLHSLYRNDPNGIKASEVG